MTTKTRKIRAALIERLPPDFEFWVRSYRDGDHALGVYWRSDLPALIEAATAAGLQPWSDRLNTPGVAGYGTLYLGALP